MTKLLEKLNGAFLTVLNWFKHPELIPPVDEGVEIENIPFDEKKDFPKNFSQLLDNLEVTFDFYKIKTYSSSWLDADSRLGLKKLGAFVPNPWNIYWSENTDKIKVNVSKGMPTIIFISTPHHKIKNDNYSSPAYFFAIKHKKLPWYIESKEGIPYQFGMTYNHDKLFWHCSWLVVKEDGSFEFCKEHRHNLIKIDHKGKIKGAYSKHIYKETEMIQDFNLENKNGENIMKNCFRASFNWWVDRTDSWSVAVKKNKDRVTFCVDKSLTKKYFADRDKTILTPTGQKKKIIHYVKSHDRNYGHKITKVKEHIRGINMFSWKGYQCTVSAPEFGMNIASSFTIGADKFEEKSPEYVSLGKVGAILANFEEKQAQRV